MYEELGKVADVTPHWNGDGCIVRLVYNQSLDAGDFVAIFMGFEAAYAVNSPALLGVNDSKGNAFSKLGRSDAQDGISNQDTNTYNPPVAVIMGGFLSAPVVAGDYIPLVQNQFETTPFIWGAYGFRGVRHGGSVLPEVLFRATNQFGMPATPTVTEIARGSRLNDLPPAPGLPNPLYLDITVSAPVPAGTYVFVTGYTDDEGQSVPGTFLITDDKGNTYQEVSTLTKVLTSGAVFVAETFIQLSKLTTALEIGDKIHLLFSWPNSDDFPFHDQPFAAVAFSVSGEGLSLVTQDHVDTPVVEVDSVSMVSPELRPGMAGLALATHYVGEVDGSGLTPFYSNSMWETGSPFGPPPRPIFHPDSGWNAVDELDHPAVNPPFSFPILHFRLYPFWRYLDGTEADPVTQSGKFSHVAGGGAGFSLHRISTIAVFKGCFTPSGKPTYPVAIGGIATPVPDPGPHPYPVRVCLPIPARRCLALGLYVTEKEPGGRGYDVPVSYPDGNLQIDATWTRGDPRYTGEPTSHHDILNPSPGVCNINPAIGPSAYLFSMHPAWKVIPAETQDEFEATLDYRYFWTGVVVGLGIDAESFTSMLEDSNGFLYRSYVSQGQAYVDRSVDAGVTWTPFKVGTTAQVDGNAAPTLARDRWDHLFCIWNRGDSLFTAVSVNAAETWSTSQESMPASLHWPMMAVMPSRTADEESADRERFYLAGWWNGKVRVYGKADWSDSWVEMFTVDSMPDLAPTLVADRRGALNLVYADSSGVVRHRYGTGSGVWSAPVTLATGAGFPVYAVGTDTAFLAYFSGNNLHILQLDETYRGTPVSVEVPSGITFDQGRIGLLIDRRGEVLISHPVSGTYQTRWGNLLSWQSPS